MIEIEVVAEGAEAVLRRTDGKVVKERVKKGYRHPGIDSDLRKERTDLESRLMRKAAASGVRVPGVEIISDTELEMDFVEGEKLKDVLEENMEICEEIGRNVARLHQNGVIHGDLTTSNMILSEGEIHFIDFGLGRFSERVEDMATDLHLLKEVFESTHGPVSGEAIESVLEGYREEKEGAERVLERYGEVEERGRYK